jgi:rhodanese-related sulfurtransferase
MPPPQYFFEDARINKTGYEPIEDVIRNGSKPLSAAQVRKLADEGAVILDTRPADEFEEGFIPGSVNIGLDGQFAVWVGTLIDINKKIVLVTNEGKEQETVLRLARVGFENVLGYLEGPVNFYGTLDTVRSINAEAVRSEIDKGAKVLDVRKHGEWNISHLKNAIFLPLTEFPGNLVELKKDKTYIVHCGGGYRSMVAISIMKKHGFEKLLNVPGGFGTMKKAGLEVVTEEVLL